MKVYISYLLLLSVIAGSSCAHKWEDHIGIADPESQKNLYEVIGAQSDFSAFFGLLEKSGYADVLKASKNYTVIVPTNAAIQTVKGQYDFNDTAVVRSFVGYHIINSIYNVNELPDTIRAKNLRNKYVEFTHGAFDGVPAVQKNRIAGNGIFHVVNTPLTPLQNIYTLVTTKFPETYQAGLVLSFDTTTIASWINDIRRPMVTENARYTYFVVDDDYYNDAYSKLTPFYYTHYDETVRDSTTAYFTNKALLRDLVVPGDIHIDGQTAVLTSLSGTVFSVDPEDIVTQFKASNGTVYRVKKLDCKLTDRVKEIKVLGALPAGYKQNDKRANTFFRSKRDTLGNLYNDIEIYDHKVTSFYVKYRAANAYSVTYKVYGRAIMGLAGDPQTATFTQYLQYFNPAAVSVNEPDLYNLRVKDTAGATVTRVPFVVQPLNHDEVYLGEVTQDEFGYLRLLIMSSGTGPIILEYLRFVPQIQ
ncbi:fasciclin domain-containing protein [Niabella hirudinis]|uniref:fasciclin domain-containing protein n=1 Tax=Niabella hirudinis TaxID=1285929 RepID=UPI003EBC3F3B